MRKFIIWALALAMFAGVAVSPIQAMEPLRLSQNKAVVEKNRNKKPKRPDPKSTRHKAPRSHKKSSNSGLGWAIAGAVVGAAIATGAANSSRAPEPVLVCDQYGNCYYVYQ